MFDMYNEPSTLCCLLELQVSRQHRNAAPAMLPWHLLIACGRDSCSDWALQVFVLAGPCGAGRSTLARQLLRDFGDKLMPAPLLTNRCAPDVLATMICNANSSMYMSPTHTSTMSWPKSDMLLAQDTLLICPLLYLSAGHPIPWR